MRLEGQPCRAKSHLLLPLRNSLMERPAAEIVSLVDGGAVAEQVTEH